MKKSFCLWPVLPLDRMKSGFQSQRVPPVGCGGRPLPEVVWRTSLSFFIVLGCQMPIFTEYSVYPSRTLARIIFFCPRAVSLVCFLFLTQRRANGRATPPQQTWGVFWTQRCWGSRLCLCGSFSASTLMWNTIWLQRFYNTTCFWWCWSHSVEQVLLLIGHPHLWFRCAAALFLSGAALIWWLYLILPRHRGSLRLSFIKQTYARRTGLRSLSRKVQCLSNSNKLFFFSWFGFYFQLRGVSLLCRMSLEVKQAKQCINRGVIFYWGLFPATTFIKPAPSYSEIGQIRVVHASPWWTLV